MFLKAGVMFQLQKAQMIGEAAVADPPSGNPTLNRVAGHFQQPQAMQSEFLTHVQCAMRLKRGVFAIREHDEPMIERAVKDMLAHVAPMRRRHGGFHICARQSLLHLGNGNIH